jgi:hypothetical protein
MAGIMGGIKGSMKKKFRGGMYQPTGTNSQALYTTPGTYTFTVPSGVYSIHAVAVGGGGGAGSETGSGGGGSIGNGYGGATGVGGSSSVPGGSGGAYGGGCGGSSHGAQGNQSGYKGGDGAVRILWGTGRSFPSTNTHDY